MTCVGCCDDLEPWRPAVLPVRSIRLVAGLGLILCSFVTPARSTTLAHFWKARFPRFPIDDRGAA